MDYEDRVRELLDHEDSARQQRILSTFESFKRWLSVFRDIIQFVVDLYRLYVYLRSIVFGY